MSLLERDDVLARLRHLLRKAGTGHGHVAALVGEAGVGKTSVVRSIAAASTEHGIARVHWGACEDLSVPDPLAPLYDMARAAKWNLSPTIGRDSRLPVFSEALALLDRGDMPSLVVIEDLHWADNATLDFVRYIGRRVRDSHILLLLTARSDSSLGRMHVRRALSDVPSQAVEKCELMPLSESAVADLAWAAGQNAAELYRVTAGNAFFVTELLAAGRTDDPPSSVYDAVLGRVDRVPQAARAIIDAVSIFPRRAEASLVDALCAVSHKADIEACIANGILVADGTDLTFRHEIARRAVEGALTEPTRRDLNARALVHLRAADVVSAARIAHHAAQAGDSAAVLEFAPIAAEDAARVGAHREAAEHFRAALSHADPLPAAARASLYERYAFECHVTGQMVVAIEAQSMALDLHRASGNRLKVGDCLRWLSRMHYLAGDRMAADALGHEAVEVLADMSATPESAMAFSNLAQLGMLADDVEQAETLGNKAIVLAEQLNRPDILCHALNNVATAVQWRDLELSRRQLDSSLAIALERGLQEHAARAYTNRAWIAINHLESVEARSLLDAGIAYCAERDLDTWRDYMTGWLAELLLQQGDWTAAGDAAMRVVGNDDAAPLSRYPAALALARLRSRRGDPSIVPLIDELRCFLRTGSELQRLAPYSTLVAERAWIGEAPHGEALNLLDQVIAMATDAVMIPQVFAWRRRLDPSSAIPRSERYPLPFRLAFGGNWRAAASAWEKFGAPYEHALSLSEGDVEAQREGLRLLDLLGANAVAGRLRRQMREAGIRGGRRGPRATTRANPAGLTRRQMDVLRLMDQGWSNARIAQSLFVSPKTVDHHVSAILDKLSAGSRGEAAAIARREGLL